MEEKKKKFVRKVKCYRCDAEITFDKTMLSENGVPIPLNPEDGTPHDCPNSPYNARKRQRQKALAAAA